MLFDENQPIEVEASLGKRFGNFIIDGICIGVINTVMGFTLGIIFALTGNGEVVENPGINLFLQLMGLGTAFFYYLFFESAFQKTPGKFITRTKVIMSSGEKPQAGAIAVRTLCRFIPFEPLVGLFTSSFWHDSIPNTKVIDS